MEIVDEQNEDKRIEKRVCNFTFLRAWIRGP